MSDVKELSAKNLNLAVITLLSPSYNLTLNERELVLKKQNYTDSEINAAKNIAIKSILIDLHGIVSLEGNVSSLASGEA